MQANDPDDNWSRLLLRLRERRGELVGNVTGGQCDLPQYHDLCGRIAQIDDVIELAGRVRRGEDRRALAHGEVRTVED